MTFLFIRVFITSFLIHIQDVLLKGLNSSVVIIILFDAKLSMSFFTLCNKLVPINCGISCCLHDVSFYNTPILFSFAGAAKPYRCIAGQLIIYDMEIFS